MIDRKFLNLKDWGKKHGRVEHWRVIGAFLILYDMIAVNAAFFLALWLRYDFQFNDIKQVFLQSFYRFSPYYTGICILVFFLLHLYQSVWRFASFRELERIVIATLITGAIQVGGTLLFVHRMPISYYVIGIILQFVLVTSVRFLYRFGLLLKASIKKMSEEMATKVMLIGAGNAGQLLMRDIAANAEGREKVCCIIDDNPNKWHRYIDGVPIVGGREDILLNVKKYSVKKIYFAIPTASPADTRDILNICNETECELKILPGIHQMAQDQVSLNAMKDVAIEDLLGREPIQTDMAEISEFLKGKTILVTGGGGSIGSELCRQIAANDPKRLIIFDIYENNAYAIQLELKEKYPDLDLVTLIGSVRDSLRLDQIFAEYRPDVVYHAAAHKHVPLMEYSPCEAIKNNAIGTYKTAYAAMKYGVKRFVLISTDKAVNPTNIMGASKRLCEMVVQSFDRLVREKRANEIPPLFTHHTDEHDRIPQERVPVDACTEFVAVRFGNVLGSNGSVVPVFKRQIERGGPVTVTHPDIIRYFMTVPEAVGLVLQAGTYAHGGEIFVLDMGSPVKIDTLARNLIKLSGFRPDEDIKIEYTGLRPGEKLYEEKLMAEEGMKKTKNERIHIGSPIPFDEDEFLRSMERLMAVAYANREQDIRTVVAGMVSTYHPAGEHGNDKKDDKYEELTVQMLACTAGKTVEGQSTPGADEDVAAAADALSETVEAAVAVVT